MGPLATFFGLLTTFASSRHVAGSIGYLTIARWPRTTVSTQTARTNVLDMLRFVLFEELVGFLSQF